MELKLKNFFNECVQTVTAPKNYFINYQKLPEFKTPIIKASVFGLIAGIITFIWSLLGIIPTTSLIKSFISGILLLPLTSIIMLFIGSLILLLISMICGGSKSYKESVHIQACLLVMVPVNSFFSFTYAVNIYLGILAGIVLSLYALWLSYNGIVYGLSGKPLRARIVVGIVACMIVLLSILSVVALKTAERMLDKSGISIEELQKNPEEAGKKVQEIMKKYFEEQQEREK